MVEIQTASSDKQAFETFVQSLLDQGGVGSFGKIHLVSILSDGDNTALGALMSKATSIIESVITSRLSRDEVWQRVSLGKYLMLFPRLSDSEGALKAAAISREIKERLFGQSVGKFKVSVQVLPLSVLKGRPPATAAKSMETVLDAHSARNSVVLQVLYQPLWDAGNQCIIGNRAITRREFQGHELFDDAVQFAGEQDPIAIDRNDSILSAIGSKSINPGIVFMPQAINNHTLTNLQEWTLKIGQLVETCPDGLVVELTGAIAGLSHQKIRDVVTAAKDGGAKVGVRIFPEPDLAKFLKECGISYLCFNEDQAKAAGFTHSALYALLAVVAHEVRGLDFALCLWNASTGQDIKRARSLDFTLFSGKPVGKNQATMANPGLYPTSKVFL